ncbi:hypothetical protein [Chitinophaga caseinilytica]|uniref:Outer membrane transport energization protein TonB n=1 Tax=Chitinophaga caseinilytica TaxID=2267521 RepID=A0ABZ2YWT3_9BACT
MTEQNKSKNIKAAGITIGVHALLLLALVMVSLDVPPPLPDQDMGIEVNLGTSDDGMGDEQPLNPNPPAAAQPEPSTPQPAAASKADNSNSQELATSDEAEAPEVIKQPVKPVNVKPKEIAKTLEPKPVKAPKPKAEAPPAPVPPAPKPKPKAVFTGGTGNAANSGNGADGSNNSTGEGNTGKPGDRGVIGGSPNGGAYTGTPGAGRGASDFRLAGRTLVNRPSVEWDGNETGYVAINIKVDRNGNVVSATHNLRGSTISNPAAIREAKEAALRIKYNVSQEAPEEQFGPIRFYFKPR